MNAALAAMRQDFVEPAPDLLADTLAGLSRTPKRLMSKYFYDARGSQLFEQITRQPEYYLTRVEQALLDARLDDIAAADRCRRACRGIRQRQRPQDAAAARGAG